VVVTDSVVPRAGLASTPGLPLQTESIAALVAAAVDRLHRSEPLEELLLRS
jgi:hypothetical protein